MKNVLGFVVVIVVGALVGSFLGQLLSLLFPTGSIHALFAHQIQAGLSPSHLDLRVLDLTFGCMLRFNIMTVIGIILAAIMFKKIFG